MTSITNFRMAANLTSNAVRVVAREMEIDLDGARP